MVDPVFLLFAFVNILFAFVVHELAHGYAAYQLGDPTAKYEGRLTWNPVKHVDPIGAALILGTLALSGGRFVMGWGKPVQYDSENFKHEFRDVALVALAGPAINYLLALAGWITLYFVPVPVPLLYSFLYSFTMVNLGLALFNCIPCPPLDGWKVVQYFVATSTARSMQRFEARHGVVPLLVLMLFLMVLPDPIDWIFYYAMQPLWMKAGLGA
ncbi:MAG: site-2 protease family protein [Candidatus Eremiobacterota bacterium]